MFKAISGKTKLLSFSLLWICILYSVIFVVTMAWIQILLLLIAISVSIHILSLKPLTKEMLEALKHERAFLSSSLPIEGKKELSD